MLFNLYTSANVWIGEVARATWLALWILKPWSLDWAFKREQVGRCAITQIWSASRGHEKPNNDPVAFLVLRSEPERGVG